MARQTAYKKFPKFPLLKNLSRELAVPIIAVSDFPVRLNAPQRFPTSDLRESGAIEQDADVVLMFTAKTQRKTRPPRRYGCFHPQAQKRADR